MSPESRKSSCLDRLSAVGFQPTEDGHLEVPPGSLGWRLGICRSELLVTFCSYNACHIDSHCVYIYIVDIIKVCYSEFEISMR